MTTYYVGPGGDDGATGLSWALRKLTLNGAENIPVAAGDTVYVGPGTYREMLTVDVAGSEGNQISYIGDYSGANTDGVGGVVRITGSDNDQSASRANCITANGKSYRTFTGFTFDMTTGTCVSTVTTVCDYWTVSKCMFLPCGGTHLLAAIGSGHWTVDQCVFWQHASNYCLVFSKATTIDNTASVVQNCLFLSGSILIQVQRVGGITVKNCTFMARGNPAIEVVTALAAGQTLTINNCIISSAVVALKATATGELLENYNTLYGNITDRTNVDVGANSNTYPPLFDTRWFFEAVGGEKILSPFDLASYSQLVNLAGTSPSTTDLRGAAKVGAQREWGAFEYDATYFLPRVASVLDSAGGTYHAPEASEVTSNAVFGVASGTAGTYHRPETSEVVDSATFGIASGQTGLVHLPDAGEVTSNAVFGVSSGTTGTYHRPEVSEVIDSATFGITSGQTGTVHLPEVAEVIDSASFGAASALTGTYHAPSVGEVIDTAVFGPASGTAGTFSIPAEADVKDGVFYGAAGTEFEGEYAAGGGMLAANKRGNKQ